MIVSSLSSVCCHLFELCVSSEIWIYLAIIRGPILLVSMERCPILSRFVA